MHPRNRHQSRYDLKALSKKLPSLKPFIILNKYGNESIDFTNPEAVKTLNQALLKDYYDVNWDLPREFLCPPIPGRADYIHYSFDLLGPGPKKVLDIGVGANCIYPIIGTSEYDWEFVGSDINSKALKAAEVILDLNPSLQKKIHLRLQENPEHIFKGIILPNEKFDLTICNPPFHSSPEEASEGTNRKWKNLGKGKSNALNFGGISSELWTEGGEKAFIKNMIDESKDFSSQVKWFSTLVSKEDNLPFIYKLLKKAHVKEVKTFNMDQGQKKSRFIAWCFPLV